MGSLDFPMVPMVSDIQRPQTQRGEVASPNSHRNHGGTQTPAAVRTPESEASTGAGPGQDPSWWCWLVLVLGGHSGGIGGYCDGVTVVG